MAQGGNWLTACPLGPRCDPMCSESKLTEGDAAEGFCEVRHTRQTCRAEQAKGGETVRASEMTRAWFRPVEVSYDCEVSPADRPAFGGRLRECPDIGRDVLCEIVRWRKELFDIHGSVGGFAF